MFLIRRFDKVSIDFQMGSSNTALGAWARLSIHYLPKPVKCPVVNSFSYIAAEIESAMVGSTKNQDEFIFSVLHFWNPKFRILPFEEIGVDQAGFMPQKLVALAEMLRE